MSNDAGWPGPGYPSPGYPQGYPPPGYFPVQQHGYPPPGYPPPGYGPPGYPPPGFQPGFQPGFEQGGGVLKPGVIPLRRLALSDIFNGAVNYIRRNPKATLGLTAIVVVIAQVISLILQIFGPLIATGEIDPTMGGEGASATDIAVLSGSSLAGSITTAVASVVLSGMLTVIVGRAVFGADITIGDAWQRVRSRVLALLGFTLLETLAVVLVIAVVVVAIVAVSAIGGGVAGFLVGAPLAIATLVLIAFVATSLLFAPALIVLERLGIVDAARRSFTLVKKDFWRVLGIWILAAVAAAVIAGAVGVPFSFGGALLSSGADSDGAAVAGLVLIAVGGAIGQILTAPFSAGVVVLLYTDRRIRAEAFDLVLRTGAAAGPGVPADSTDHLWLIRHP